MKKAQDTYYALRGWDDDGIPTEENMKIRTGLRHKGCEKIIPCPEGNP